MEILPARERARGSYESRAFLSSTHVIGSGGFQDNDHGEELRVVRKAALQKRFEALAHIRGDRISPQLLPQGDRLAVGLQEPPAILAVGNMHLKGVPEAWLEGVFEIIDNEVDHLSTLQHRWWPVARSGSSIGSGKPSPELPYELRPALHAEVCLRST
jgi:hypothetical protein